MQKNNKTILVLGALSVVTCLGVVGGLAFNNEFKTAAQNKDIYEINFTKDKNKLPETGSTLEVFTDEGSPYLLSHIGIFGGQQEAPNAWAAIAGKNATFSFEKNTAYERNNGFNGMKSLQMEFLKAGSKFQIYFSHDGDGTKFDEKYSKEFTSIAGTMNIEFEGHPNYFMFKTLDDTVNDIISMKITYSCKENEDDNWNKSHGVVPVVSDTTVKYGLFPRSHVSDPELISALTAKADALEIEDEEYFWYNDEYYVRDTPEPKEDKYTYSDGSIVKAETGAKHFFLCEALTWNIVASDDNNYTLDCFNVPYGRRFAAESNVYANSDLRTWLNNGFYSAAFFINSGSSLVPTSFPEIGEDEDKIFVGSKHQYENVWYKDESVDRRKKEVSDFALCNYTSMSTDEATNRNGYYWTCTPYADSSSTAWYMTATGGSAADSVENNYIGASPSITIKK